MVYERVIIGAGLYGLYAAWICGKKGLRTIVLEKENESFKRATYINQARVHKGYHYPRSLSTAKKSADYFARFCDDFGFCIHSKFDQIYATSSDFSWTSAVQFEKFCKDADIYCKKALTEEYFNEGVCDGAFLTEEFTYDAHILKDFFIRELKKISNVEIVYNAKIYSIKQESDCYKITYNSNEIVSGFIVNVTYASVNQVLSMVGYDRFKIKYELCEIILCEVCEKLKKVGLTVMDGPFFSIMPFGRTNLHSLTSVSFTPHVTSYSEYPVFSCQGKAKDCSDRELGNCNTCEYKPQSAWEYMSKLAMKYIKPEYTFEYVSSLYSMKPILKSSEIDDSRPTVIKISHREPTFISVLSGKINTVYDLDQILL